jgi:hypothetical protein
MRWFVNWLVAEDILSKDPLAGIVVDKPEPPPVPILTDEDLTALLNACKGKGFNDLRDAAVIRLPSSRVATRTSRSSFSSCGVGMHQCRFRRFGRRRSCGRRGGQFRV